MTSDTGAINHINLKNAYLVLERKIDTKKGGNVLLLRTQLNSAFIEHNQRKFLLVMMCALLLVSRSGLYVRLIRKPSKGDHENKTLDSKIKTIFLTHIKRGAF